MTVEARFICEKTEQTVNGEAVEFKCDTQDQDWSKWTPYGSMNLGILNPKLNGHFKPGKKYRVLIIEV